MTDAELDAIRRHRETLAAASQGRESEERVEVQAIDLHLSDVIIGRLLADRDDLAARLERAEDIGRLVGAAPIAIWPYHEAPEHLRALASKVGDEAWMVWSDAAHAVEAADIAESLQGFDGDPEEHELPFGAVIYITAHG